MFCYVDRTCPTGMVFKECGTNCPLTCDNYKNYDCQLTGCRRGCFCPRNKVLADNGTCVDKCNPDTPPPPPTGKATMCVERVESVIANC